MKSILINAMFMKKYISCMAALSFVLSLLISCAETANLKNGIIGKQAEQNSGENIELFDITILDKRTKLMWTRDGNIAGKDMTRSEAFKFVEQLNMEKYGGYSDWRLPVKDELKTLVSYAKDRGAENKFHELLNSTGFKNVQAYGYWSSTAGAVYTATAGGWVVGMWGGVMSIDYEAGSHYVWPVRSGQ
ncbi:MAG: DUF1566 domain-containing protein [Deltaproteobacteria bacterium]|nr:DUF1566 domain-containing protein [Deltaproteobacteria bacterium]